MQEHRHATLLVWYVKLELLFRSTATVTIVFFFLLRLFPLPHLFDHLVCAIEYAICRSTTRSTLRSFRKPFDSTRTAEVVTTFCHNLNDEDNCQFIHPGDERRV